MKIGKYIFEILPNNASNPHLNIPYQDTIWYSIPYNGFTTSFTNKAKHCKHIKPNTGIRYKIIGFYYRLLIIKQLN